MALGTRTRLRYCPGNPEAHMAKIFNLEEINAALEGIDVVRYIEEGFVA